MGFVGSGYGAGAGFLSALPPSDGRALFDERPESSPLFSRTAPIDGREGLEAMTRTEEHQVAGRRRDWARERGSRPFDRARRARRRHNTALANRTENSGRSGPDAIVKLCVSQRESEPTITAVLERGPLAGRRIDVDVVEGRPPKTIDMRAADGSACRYCLADWTQTGPSAIYTFLYLI